MCLYRCKCVCMYPCTFHLPTDPSPLLPNPHPHQHTGIWALWLYRLSHVLWRRDLPWVSRVVPRFVMALVRYVTSVDIHPAAKISGKFFFYVFVCVCVALLLCCGGRHLLLMGVVPSDQPTFQPLSTRTHTPYTKTKTNQPIHRPYTLTHPTHSHTSRNDTQRAASCWTTRAAS